MAFGSQWNSWTVLQLSTSDGRIDRKKKERGSPKTTFQSTCFVKNVDCFEVIWLPWISSLWKRVKNIGCAHVGNKYWISYFNWSHSFSKTFHSTFANTEFSNKNQTMRHEICPPIIRLSYRPNFLQRLIGRVRINWLPPAALAFSDS